MLHPAQGLGAQHQHQRQHQQHQEHQHQQQHQYHEHHQHHQQHQHNQQHHHLWRRAERLLLLTFMCSTAALLLLPPQGTPGAAFWAAPGVTPLPGAPGSGSPCACAGEEGTPGVGLRQEAGTPPGVPGGLLPGPLDAFEREGVSAAPGATMGNGQLKELGQTARHKDSRGHILRVSLGPMEGRSGGAPAVGPSVGVVNLMRTEAGSLRSGDMHNCTQFDVALGGRVRLRMTDLGSGQEVVTEYDGRNDFIAIPPRVPHLFEFVEESLMIEWWDCDFQAWHYKPYRDMIAKALATAAERREP